VRVVSTRSEVDTGDYYLLDLGGFCLRGSWLVLQQDMVLVPVMWSRGMAGRLGALRWMDPCSDLGACRRRTHDLGQ